MIPDYKLYHGAVLADIVDKVAGPVTFQERVDSGRLLNYVVNDGVGLQIKYATARLRPWNFSFSDSQFEQLLDLWREFPSTFLVLVCRNDGFVCVPANQVVPFLSHSPGIQPWLRVDRRKRGMYRLYGPLGEFSLAIRTTTDPVVEALEGLRLLHSGSSDFAQREDLPSCAEFDSNANKASLGT